MAIGKDLTELINEYRISNYRKKEVILSPGDANSGVFYLEKGYVRSYLLTEEGWNLTLNIFSPGSIFPLSQVLAGVESNPHEFEALTDVRIRKIPAVRVIEYMKGHPDEAWTLLSRLASGTEGLVQRMKHLFRSTAEKRVISGIDLLGKKFGVEQNNGGLKIDFPHTHQDIADIAGVTRETVTKVLMKLIKEGIVLRQGKKTLIKNRQKILDSLSYEGGGGMSVL